MKKEKKNKTVFAIFLTLTVIWLCVIFLYSAKDGNESSETSHFVGMLFGKIFVPGFRKWSFEKQDAFAGTIDYPLRKVAHGVEYGILGFLSYMSLHTKKGHSLITSAVFAFAFSVLYAISDEIHQYFVPGRACKLTDVLIDSLGAFLVIFVTFLITKKKIAKNNLQKNKDDKNTEE